MQEHSVMEVVKWFLGLMLIWLMITVAIFCYRSQDINTFRQQVNYQIERRGGLTNDALASLDRYSKDKFGGMFSVSTDNNQKVEFGDKVNYTIHAKIPVQFIAKSNVNVSAKGTGISQVR